MPWPQVGPLRGREFTITQSIENARAQLVKISNIPSGITGKIISDVIIGPGSPSRLTGEIEVDGKFYRIYLSGPEFENKWVIEPENPEEVGNQIVEGPYANEGNPSGNISGGSKKKERHCGKTGKKHRKNTKKMRKAHRKH